ADLAVSRCRRQPGGDGGDRQLLRQRVSPGAGGKHLYAADIDGDKLDAYRYRSDNTQPLQAGTVCDAGFVTGAGPRHMVLSPEGEYAYVITEMVGEIEAITVNDNRLTLRGKVKLNGGLDSAEAKSGRFGDGRL
ncbi:beta-propeller fold lactonase family protein, partial [Serratia ureilytica]|nr:beta-propeller fold lactonase family protein [Serratia ureilytica]